MKRTFLFHFFLDEVKEFIRFCVAFCLEIARISSFQAENCNEVQYSKTTIERKEV